jgi:caffeoyl-CoA O-methyltransferase
MPREPTVAQRLPGSSGTVADVDEPQRASSGAPRAPQPALDARVGQFLESNRTRWRDWNVPFEDGKILHDLVVAGRFTRILEIGTSTGHSTIWLAWAASKTGGKVITIEIDPGRHRIALENFRKAGVEAYIDARLADAHRLVRELPGPFDFVFNDADKEWYLNYFKDLDAKVAVGGCFTAHNTLRISAKEVRDFLEYVKAKANYRTRIERESGEGISVSCKTAP